MNVPYRGSISEFLTSFFSHHFWIYIHTKLNELRLSSQDLHLPGFGAATAGAAPLFDISLIFFKRSPTTFRIAEKF